MNRPQPSIRCDTVGCGATLTAIELLSYRKEWAIAAEHGWRHDLARLRRCPACVTKGWPDCMPCDGPVPDRGLYLDPADGVPDYGPLFAWCDATYGPLQNGPLRPQEPGGWRTVTVWKSQDDTGTEKIEAVTT